MVVFACVCVSRVRTVCHPLEKSSVLILHHHCVPHLIVDCCCFNALVAPSPAPWRGAWLTLTHLASPRSRAHILLAPSTAALVVWWSGDCDHFCPPLHSLCHATRCPLLTGQSANASLKLHARSPSRLFNQSPAEPKGMPDNRPRLSNAGVMSRGKPSHFFVQYPVSQLSVPMPPKRSDVSCHDFPV